MQHASGDQRHDGDEGFHQHPAKADQLNIAFVVDHLGRRARADQRMKARNCAASNGDRHKRPDRALDDRTAAVNEVGQRRHLQHRVHKDDAQRQRANRADFHVGRQVIARGKQKPDRQGGGEEGVDRQRKFDAGFGQREPFAHHRALDAVAKGHGQNDQRHAQHRPVRELVRTRPDQ